MRWLLLVVSCLFTMVAAAQDYSFPTSSSDYGHFYPTAYKDHGGRDWACGTIRYSGHRGSDYGVGGFGGMDAGRDVVAAATGTVTRRNDGEFDRCTSGACAGGAGFGNYVYVRHANGRTTIYAHLKRGSVRPQVGDVVQCGQKIGEVGSSGSSTGPHLHFEVRNSGNVAEDPFDGPCSAPPSYWVSQGSHGGRPSRSCPSAASCSTVGSLSCGQTLRGSNSGSGSHSRHADYGCSPFQTTGREKSWTFRTPVNERVTLSLTGLSADLDLFVTRTSACNGSDCVAGSWEGNTSNESLSFNATANHTYTVTVDGYAGATSAFNLSASCTGGVPNYRAQLVSTAGLPSSLDLEVDEVVSGSVRLRNTGRATWSAGSVRLATTGPRDRVSPLRHATWLGGNRVRSNPSAVAPGGEVTLAIDLQAPREPGAWRESFGLVAEGITWFADQGGPADAMLSFDVTVVDPTPQWRGELVEMSGFPDGPWELQSGETLGGMITVRNTGQQTWQPGVVWLATTNTRFVPSQLAHPSWRDPAHAATVQQAVPRGEVATFDVLLQAGATEGDFVEALGLLAEDITWFSDDGGPQDQLVRWPVHIGPRWRAQVESVCCGPEQPGWTLPPGESQSVSVVLRNTGSYTWPPGEVGLRAARPRGRASVLADATWTDPQWLSRSEREVAPGEIVELTATVRAPPEEGAYAEAFSVAPSSRWFADEGGPGDDALEWQLSVLYAHRANVRDRGDLPVDGAMALQPGESVSGLLTVENTGSASWPVGSVHLQPTTHDEDPAARSWVASLEPPTNQTATAPGQTTTFRMAWNAPETPGRVDVVYGFTGQDGRAFDTPPSDRVQWTVVVDELDESLPDDPDTEPFPSALDAEPEVIYRSGRSCSMSSGPQGWHVAWLAFLGVLGGLRRRRRAS